MIVLCVCFAEFEDKYVKLHRLGTGSFGSVYAGKRKEDNLSVAIKYIVDDDCLDYLVSIFLFLLMSDVSKEC